MPSETRASATIPEHEVFRRVLFNDSGCDVCGVDIAGGEAAVFVRIPAGLYRLHERCYGHGHGVALLG